MLSFSDWTISDQDSVLSKDEHRVSWLRADRTAVRYVGTNLRTKDDFSHSFTVNIEEGEVEDELNRGFIRLWELRNDWKNRVWIYARKDGEGWTVHYEQLEKGRLIFEVHGTYVFSFNKPYSITLCRSDTVYKITVKDENTVLEIYEETSIPETYDHIWLASTIKSKRNNGNWSTGYIESLKIS